MKSIVFLFSIASLACAADFYNGQAARSIIGQRTFTLQENTPADQRLGAAGGIAIAGDTLFVVDANRLAAEPENHRVLIYKGLSTLIPSPFDEIQPNTGRCPVCLGRGGDSSVSGQAAAVVGQVDFTKSDIALTQTGLRLPTAVASDGVRMVVADTDNNRVLIWNSIPSTGQGADVVVGQPDFKTATPNEGKGNTPTARGLRGPQGVWIQDGKLYVADTHNHRVLVWNTIPTQNFQPANIVLGAPDFSSFVQPDLTKPQGDPKATSMLNPVAVSSDGVRLFVTDLGYNRVLIWNRIPTANQAAADLAVGQPDLVSGVANNSSKLCESNGTDPNDSTVLTYPGRCGKTLDFPRFALSDGKRLFIADGGNDRVLVFNTIPTDNGALADVVLGQSDLTGEWISDNANPLKSSAADALRTPTSLAWDGTNLYVADPFNRRVMVFTPADNLVPLNGIRNAASREVFGVGSVTFSGSVKEGDSVVITIADAAATATKTYTYKFVKDDTVGNVIQSLVNLINADGGDPNVLASPNPLFSEIILTARVGGEGGNGVTVTATAKGVDDKTAAEVAVAAVSTTGGGDAARIAPGTVVILKAVDGATFTDSTASAPDVKPGETLPFELGGVQVYFDGIRAPMFSVSPTEITAQVPWEVTDSESINAYVRTVRDGKVVVTAPRAVTVIPQNPGIFADPGDDPRPGVAYHGGNGYASGIISVDGSAKTGDTATVTIEDRSYTYTVTDTDVNATVPLVSIRDNLINLINANNEERVVAYPSYYYSRIRLQSKAPGDLGNGIAYSVTTSTDAQVLLNTTTTTLCCAATGRITTDNPALPGELIVVYATGLGLVGPQEAKDAAVAGVSYNGPVFNDPNSFVNALAGSKTANVINAGLKPGTVGVYEVLLQLNSDLPTNDRTQLTIAQDAYVSNIVTIPVYNPNPPVVE